MSKTKNKPGIHLHKSGMTGPNGKSATWYWWHIVARNGRIIARSSETYSRKSGAVKSIRIVANIFINQFKYSSLKGCPVGSYYDHSKPDSPLQSYL